MKKFALATVMSLIAASAMASGAPTDSYPYGYQPHGDLSAVTKEQPRAVPHRPAKSDDSVKLVAPAAQTQTDSDNTYVPLRRTESR
ncbi:MAG TPA: hypothetical protein PLK27_02895 [Neisseria sp.]|nr:hypothetical protein [Neisseria sp.]